MEEEKARRTRWITVCEVDPDKYVLRGNAGYPHSIWIYWRGRSHPFRPIDALNWREFLGMLDRQLHLKGLKREDMEIKPQEMTPRQAVRVQVSRHPLGKLEKQIRERHKEDLAVLLAWVDQKHRKQPPAPAAGVPAGNGTPTFDAFSGLCGARG